jgi:hypothetical protein
MDSWSVEGRPSIRPIQLRQGSHLRSLNGVGMMTSRRIAVLAIHFLLKVNNL